MTVLAFFISYLLNPPVNFLERYGFSRGLATGLVFLVLGGAATWGIMQLAPFVWDQFLELRAFLADREPTRVIQSYVVNFERMFPFVPEGSLSGRVDQFYNWVLGQLSGIPGILYVIVQYLLIVPFIAFFFTRDRRRMRRFVVQSVPNHFFEMMFNLYYKLDQKLGAYIRGIIIESGIIALLTVVGLWAVGVDYFVVIGVFAGVANVVPYFGPFAGAVPALVVEAVGMEDPTTLLPVVVVFLVVQLLDNVILKPVVVAKTMNLHPLIVLIVVVGGGQLYGIPGMILSIPLASMFIVVVSEANWALNNYRFVN
jgi:predicted PurR-regulated permease PerM